MARILRGELPWADLNPTRGREQAGQRPVLILSQDVFNDRSVTVIVVALTSQPLLYDVGQDSSFEKILQALPSTIAGLAAAIKTAFRYREAWAQNYSTLSALINEYQKFITRASPSYSPDKTGSEAVDTFQNNLSNYVMAEVESWRTVMLTSETERASKSDGQDVKGGRQGEEGQSKNDKERGAASQKTNQPPPKDSGSGGIAVGGGALEERK